MVQELEFQKIEGEEAYEAFATVNGDYAIHLERSDVGYVHIYQTTFPDTGYAEKYNSFEEIEELFDEDFDNIVYPKYVRIVSSSPVTKCLVKDNEQ